jgi:hypothetical protein
MRPLPQSKTHGIIHSVKVTPENLKEVADQLHIPQQEMKRLRPGDQLHIVREAQDSEINKAKQ